MKTIQPNFIPEFTFVTGPLEGCEVDSGGLWKEFYGVESYASADNDFKEGFESWCKHENKIPSEDSWQEWLMSWEDEPIENQEQ